MWHSRGMEVAVAGYECGGGVEGGG
jgi:hypothetical protein